MKGKLYLALCVSILAMLLAALPAAADGPGLSVNSDPVKMVKLELKNDIVMIAADDYARIAGADIKYPAEDKLTIEEDGKSLEMTIGQTAAQLAGQTLTAPGAPEKSGDRVLIPLRFVAGIFGYDVGWDDRQQLVSLARKEVRDGMSPEELLAKSTKACQEFNTYTMEGDLDIQMEAYADGKKNEEMPGGFTSSLYGQYQNDPFAVYMKQTIKPESPDFPLGETVVETYMTQENMYIKMPGQEWSKMDMPFSPEFFKQQQDIQSDPLKAVAQMKEFGITLNFGNNEKIDNQEYYVVNAAMDMDKFKESYRKIMEQVIQNVPGETESQDPGQEMQNFMQSMFEKMKFDCYYTSYINKNTLVCDIVKFDMKMNFDLDLPGQEAAEGDSAKPAQKVEMVVTSRGDFNIRDCGEPFSAPDISGASQAN
ncbi:antigen 332 [Desulfocucumis palustris]|uniref:Antigen 332 n=1 Tax=Desulfocucumis palustris TaxID=1898651 RepID=A0A2L2XD84_9FIRM|nr:copper amine oxidase N-terminal domain-containing protein [Desulfocucumis palustris]GBF34297.1 antigen 332 [Desulfocucumis palustris]